jgi:hypothetical protein
MAVHPDLARRAILRRRERVGTGKGRSREDEERKREAGKSEYVHGHIIAGTDAVSNRLTPSATLTKRAAEGV